MGECGVSVVSEFNVDFMRVLVTSDRAELGVLAAKAVAGRMRELLATQAQIRMVFAAAPSQNEFLAALSIEPNLDWNRVAAFQMDEYIGLSADHPASFAHYLMTHLFNRVRPGEVYLMDALQSPDDECQRYSGLIAAAPIDIVCLGIGENGHLAFNDPGVADFNDPLPMKTVVLDDTCRLQQVHDGCFPTIEAVPTTALTLTIPTLLSARTLFCVVPGPTKRTAVRRTLQDTISPDCPATILRTHRDCHLFLDCDALGETTPDVC